MFVSWHIARVNTFCSLTVSGVDEPALCQVSKQIMIHQLPPILILHMKRFEIGFDDVTKDDRHISFPEVLDMAPYCTAECIKVCALYICMGAKGIISHGVLTK